MTPEEKKAILDIVNGKLPKSEEEKIVFNKKPIRRDENSINTINTRLISVEEALRDINARLMKLEMPKSYNYSDMKF